MVGPGKRCKTPYAKDRLLVEFMTFHFRLMRKDLFDQIGGVDESRRAAQDYDMCLKLSELTDIQHIDEPLYFYRVHPLTTSHANRFQQIEDARQAVEGALRRRGLDSEMELKVEITSNFKLVKRQPGATASKPDQSAELKG